MWDLIQVKRAKGWINWAEEPMNFKVADHLNKYEKDHQCKITWLHPMEISSEYVNIIVNTDKEEGEIYDRNKQSN